jgi:hypothetical protein
METALFHATIAWMNSAQLRELLELSLVELESLIERLPDLDPVELVERLEALALLDQRRATFLDAAREHASTSRRRDEERSLRQFVLRALDEIQVPQTAGFLEDYIYARERVLLKTRGFSSLRRDENRAWRRQPGGRRAYIVPCLDTDGRAVPRWMGRSDWPLIDRIVVPGADDLWELQRFLILLRAWRQEPNELAEAVYRPLLEKYAPSLGDGEEAPTDLELLERETRGRIQSLGEAVGAQRAEAAGRLDRLTDEARLWGRGDGVGEMALVVSPVGP